MTEEQIRAIVRDEIEEMLLDDSLGLHIRTVILSMLRQLGYAEFVPPKEKRN